MGLHIKISLIKINCTRKSEPLFVKNFLGDTKTKFIEILHTVTLGIINGEKVKRAKNFKYLGLTVGSDGRCEKEMRRRIQAAWISWKKVSGVLCDRKLSARVKGKMYKSVVRPAMLSGMKTVIVTERQVGKMEVAVENGEMGTGSDKKGHDKKRIRERDCENHKAGRQTLGCKAMLVWTREKERRL